MCVYILFICIAAIILSHNKHYSPKVTFLLHSVVQPEQPFHIFLWQCFREKSFFLYISLCLCLCFRGSFLECCTVVSVWVAFISPICTSITGISPILPPSSQTNYGDTENPRWGWNQCRSHLQTITADAQRWVSPHWRWARASSSRGWYWRGCCCDTCILLFPLTQSRLAPLWTICRTVFVFARQLHRISFQSLLWLIFS